MESFGDYIRNQRELRQVSKEEVLDVTKVSMRYLEAIESDRRNTLPAVPYVVGFLRVYSNYLGLDGDAVVTRYLSCSENESQDMFGPAKEGKRKRLKRMFFTSLGFLTAALIILLFFMI